MDLLPVASFAFFSFPSFSPFSEYHGLMELFLASGSPEYVTVVSTCATIVNRVVAEFLSRQARPHMLLRPQSMPASQRRERLQEALTKLSELVDDASIATRDPTSPLSFSCVSPEVLQSQNDVLRRQMLDEHLAFSPLGMDGRPRRRRVFFLVFLLSCLTGMFETDTVNDRMRYFGFLNFRFSERYNDHWFQAEKDEDASRRTFHLLVIFLSLSLALIFFSDKPQQGGKAQSTREPRHSNGSQLCRLAQGRAIPLRAGARIERGCEVRETATLDDLEAYCREGYYWRVQWRFRAYADLEHSAYEQVEVLDALRWPSLPCRMFPFLSSSAGFSFLPGSILSVRPSIFRWS